MSRIESAQPNNITGQQQLSQVLLKLSPQFAKVKCEASSDGVNWEFLSIFTPENQFPQIWVPHNLTSLQLKITALDSNESPVCHAIRSIQELISVPFLDLSPVN